MMETTKARDIPPHDRETAAIPMTRERYELLATWAEALGFTPAYVVDHALELLFQDLATEEER